jgi:hypothetical protein
MRVCLCVILLALAACGARVDPGGGGDQDAAPPTAGGTDAGTDDVHAVDVFHFPICPAVPPVVGSPCLTPDQGCRYVDEKTGTCLAFACDGSTGLWRDAPEGC